MEQRSFDALQEVGNVGAAHAVTALSQLLEKTVMISVPRVEMVKSNQVSKLCGNPEALMAGVSFHVIGDASARILLMLPRNCAMELVDILFGALPARPRCSMNLEIRRSAKRAISWQAPT